MIPNYKKSKIDEIINFLKSLRGIENIKLLTNKEKKEILEIEKSAEKLSLMGLMPGVNQGVRDALSRTYTLSLIATNDFKWPERGIVKLIYKGVVLGEDVLNKKELKRLENNGNRVIGGAFVLYSDKINEIGTEKLNECILAISSLDLPWTENIPCAKYVIVGSPSPPTDLYIKNIMNLNEKEGTVLIGFEID
ncbi:MAG: hypothetical protein LRZ92_04660 [Methanosarcinaceae archaeon]|nr:hypothetical protein [Methanosarcinaceae archaeon]